MAKLKLDLHPIFSDSGRIESALEGILSEAELRRIEEVEIIPGKGSGALKKTVLRFLERPENRSRYHRIVKDGDNWGRLFVYFRWAHPASERVTAPAAPALTYDCFCCGAANSFNPDDAAGPGLVCECPACGSPNRVFVYVRRTGPVIHVESGY